MANFDFLVIIRCFLSSDERIVKKHPQKSQPGEMGMLLVSSLRKYEEQ